jgi:excisionase family DNA binding protein
MARDVGLLSSREAAEVLGVSRGTIVRRARKGELPGSKRAGRWVFDRRVLRRYLRDAPAAEDELEEALLDLGLAMIVQERLADPRELDGAISLEEFRRRRGLARRGAAS